MKKNLLAANRRALQFLHRAEGFDLQQPHTITGGTGKITWGQIKKLIPDGHRAALLVQPSTGAEWRREKLHYVAITGGRFEPRTGETYAQRRPAVDCNIDWFYGVGDFEEKRKAGFAAWYLIIQAREYIRVERPPEMHDFSARYNLIDFSRAGDGRGAHWIGKMTLCGIGGGNAGAWVYEPYRRFTPGTRPGDLAAVIDKSGYLLEPRKAAQRERLAAYKRKKAVAALIASDFSALENRAAAAIVEARGALAGALLDIETGDDCGDIEKRLRGLRQACWNLERYHKRENAGTLESIDIVRSTLNGIIKLCGEVIENENA